MFNLIKFNNKIKLYIMDDFKTAIKLKTDGIYYSSTNNKIDLWYEHRK